MEAIKDGVDFSNPTGRTNDHVRAKPTITNRMPHLETGALATFYRPAACLRGFTKASDHATQHKMSSKKATTLSICSIIWRERDIRPEAALREVTLWGIDPAQPPSSFQELAPTVNFSAAKWRNRSARWIFGPRRGVVE